MENRNRRVGRPRVHADGAARVAACRQRQKQKQTLGEIEAAVRKGITVAQVTLPPPALPEPEIPAVRESDDPSAWAKYTKALKTYNQLWSDFLDRSGTSMARGSRMKGSTNGMGLLITGGWDIHQMDLADSMHQLGKKSQI